MKIYLVLFTLFVVTYSFAQDNHIVTTDEGRRVLLKADFTWEYIDMQTSASTNTIKNSCNLSKDFEEPKLNNKVQTQLKKGRATISHIKKKVAKDYDCTVDDVILLSASEKKSNGSYTFCAKGKKVFYKRNGFKIMKKGKFF